MAGINGIDIFSTLDELVHPQHTAVLIYDMQVGIVRQVANGEAILAANCALLDAARRAGVRVVFTRHLSLPTEWMGSFQYRMSMAWQRQQDPAKVVSVFHRDSPNSQLAPELKVRPTEAVFDKLAMSAFEGTPLAFALRDCNIRSVIIAGIAMEIGIEPTCRQAADLGIIPILVRDACGAGNAESAAKCIETLEHMGDTILSDLTTVTALLNRHANPAK